jgi:8-oxo-dGTP diphosphatase
MLHRTLKENDINKDKWIGVGGHFEQGESPEECLLREVKEETGLTLTSYRFRGIVTFISDKWQEAEYMCLYTADGFSGEVISCNEGVLEWINKKKLLQLDLWEGDKIFLRLLDENKPFFSLKLEYKGDQLIEGYLDGRKLELFDIRTADGMITGKVKERSLIHQDGDLHGTSHVWIIRDNAKGSFDVLLQKRSANKDSFPSCYDISSAGHIPAGDDFLESAIRELEEELGIVAKPSELTYVGMHDATVETEFYGKTFRNHELSAVYIYHKAVDITQLKLQQEEVESVIWMDYETCMEQMQQHTLQHCIFMDEFLMLKEYKNFSVNRSKKERGL